MDDMVKELQAALLEIEHKVRKARLEILPSRMEETSDTDRSKGEITARAIKVIGQLAQLESSIISTRSVRDIERTTLPDGTMHITAVGKTTFTLKIEYDSGQYSRKFGEESDASQ
jgi:hypothetical protein